jgi:PKD repeat protein
VNKASRIFLFILICIFVTNFAFSVSVSSSIEPSTYYSDSKDLNLVFNVNGIIINPSQNYTFELVDPSDDFVYSLDYCDLSGCGPAGAVKYSFNGGRSEGKLKFNLTLNVSEIISDSFDWYLDAGLSTPFDTQLFSPLSGKPTGSLVLVNGDGEVPGDEGFSKNDTVIPRLVDLKDNIDDYGEEYLKCDYLIKQGGSTVVGTSDSITFNDIGLTTQTKALNNGYTQADIGSGDFVFEVDCYDRNPNEDGLTLTDSIEFSIIDQLPDINSIQFNPNTVNPDTEVTCVPTASDADDPDSDFTYTYGWQLNSTTITNTSNKFNCATNSCKDGDELVCIVTAENDSGQESLETQGEVQISSYFTSISISGKDKVQKGESVSYTANVTYDGSGTVEYTWSFGDGSTAQGKTVNHTYTEKGNFTLKLTVDDEKGSTEEVTATINVLDPDLIITIESPTTGTDLEQGGELNLKANLKDPTGTAITNATIKGCLVSGDENYTCIDMEGISGSAGKYQGTLQIPYLVASDSEIEISASSEKSGISLTSKKSVAININTFNLIPRVTLETSFEESSQIKITKGNIIDKVNICFEIGDQFDDQMKDNLILLINNKEFEMVLENTCYSATTNYTVTGNLELKLKNAEDNYGNSVRSAWSKSFEVLEGPQVLEVNLISPSKDKASLQQELKVNVKAIVRDGFNKSNLANLKGKIIYKDKEYDLELKEIDGGFSFLGAFTPETDDIVVFKVNINGTYDGLPLSYSVGKELETVDELNVELINPLPNGFIESDSKIILKITYADGSIYDANEIALNVNDENIVFTRSGNYFNASYNLPVFTTATLKITGKDKGNNLEINLDSKPIMYWFVTKTNWMILVGILGVFLILNLITWIVLRLTYRKAEYIKELYAKFGNYVLKGFKGGSDTKSQINEIKNEILKKGISFKMDYRIGGVLRKVMDIFWVVGLVVSIVFLILVFSNSFFWFTIHLGFYIVLILWYIAVRRMFVVTLDHKYLLQAYNGEDPHMVIESKKEEHTFKPKNVPQNIPQMQERHEPINIGKVELTEEEQLAKKDYLINTFYYYFKDKKVDPQEVMDTLIRAGIIKQIAYDIYKKLRFE